MARRSREPATEQSQHPSRSQVPSAATMIVSTAWSTDLKLAAHILDQAKPALQQIVVVAADDLKDGPPSPNPAVVVVDESTTLIETRTVNTYLAKARRMISSLFDYTIGFVVGKTYALDIDERCRGELDKDGTSIINWLALFVVAQGGFLAGSAKEADIALKVLVLLGIYLTLSLLTIIGLIRILRTTVDEGGNLKRAYDRTTIAYGRYILTATFIMTALLTILASFGVLPGMKIRQAYPKSDVPVTARLVSNILPTNPPSSLSLYDKDKWAMDRWIEWLNDGKKMNPNARFIWLEQINSFDKPYNGFKAGITMTNPQFKVTDKICFLRSQSQPTPEDKEKRYHPVYRQMPFNHQGDYQSNTFEVFNPEAQDQLLLLVVVKRAEGVSQEVSFPKELDQYGFSIVKQ